MCFINQLFNGRLNWFNKQIRNIFTCIIKKRILILTFYLTNKLLNLPHFTHADMGGLRNIK